MRQFPEGGIDVPILMDYCFSYIIHRFGEASLVQYFATRLAAFARAALNKNNEFENVTRPDTTLHPYKSETQPPCKYDGHEISYHCSSW